CTSCLRMSLFTEERLMSSACFCLFALTSCLFIFFFFNDPATTEIYTLSLHDALPIWLRAPVRPTRIAILLSFVCAVIGAHLNAIDRKSTRLNSSHVEISYAVFCLKKKTPAEDRRATAGAAMPRRAK